MKHFYPIYFLILLLVCQAASARGKHDSSSRGSSTIIIHLDDSRYGNIPLDLAYVVFDKYDLTGAGIIRQKFAVVNGQITITGVPEGKYLVDVITIGSYRQHLTAVMKAGKGTSDYTLRLDNLVFCPSANNQQMSEAVNVQNINTLTASN